MAGSPPRRRVTDEIDLPEVVEEVREHFERYERALASRELDVMAESFAALAGVVRFGIADRQRGPDELARWRGAQPAPRPGRTLSETHVATFGKDVAIVTTLFSYPGRPLLGRQSQTWVRLAHGWRIVHAHVSEVPSADG